MALTNCHECGNQVSTEAAACPSCGAKHVPTPSAESGMSVGSVGALVAVGFVALLAAMWHFSSDSDQPPAKACKDDLACWGERYAVDADHACERPIENLASYSVRWKQGSLETRFSRYRWKDQGAGIVTYIGDKAEFQNGFGAYTPVIYECDFDPATKQALDARAGEGRLP